MSYIFNNIDVYTPILNDLLKVQFVHYVKFIYESSNLTLFFSESLDAQGESDLTTTVNNHSSTYSSSFEYLMYSSEKSQEQDMEFSRKLLHDFMRKNKLEGMNITQSLWVFARFEEFNVTGSFGTRHVDLFKMFYAGAIPTAYYCVLRVIPDDMTQSYHWLTQPRLDWVKVQLEGYLGAGMVAYIQSLP